jgi:hypothetical protein
MNCYHTDLALLMQIRYTGELFGIVYKGVILELWGCRDCNVLIMHPNRNYGIS